MGVGIAMIFKGILIGLIFGLPVGAVGAMTVQRTWEHGIKAGLLTGMGSSAADCIYAGIGAFGLTVVSDFLLKYQMVIHLAGGMMILLMGLGLLLRKAETAQIPEVPGMFKMFLSAFAVGITNPAAILTFLFAFSWFGIAGDNTKAGGWPVVLGVFVGTYMGRAHCCGCPDQKKETGGQIPEDEPNFRSSIELVWNPCFYKGNPDMKLCEKVEKGAGIR